MSTPVILTSGEPAGIGPDLGVLLAQRPLQVPVVLLADRRVLEERATQLGLPCHIPAYPAEPGQNLSLLHMPAPAAVQAGVLNSTNGAYVLDTLRRAVQGCQRGEFAALVTGPVHKGVINDAGIPFSGHTEFLAQLTHTPRVVMMLAGGGMRVALVTTHLPLRQVADAITPQALEDTLRILHKALVRDFGLPAPRILVAGLNPHAGEGGHLGREEIEIIQPVLQRLQQAGLQLQGPLPADTLFQQKYLARCDAVLAMYHDQGLPVLKHADFAHAVNITLGLPYPRVAVDHGTALELAGSGRADPSSLFAAIATCARLAMRNVIA